jgi:hypothetical protein
MGVLHTLQARIHFSAVTRKVPRAPLNTPVVLTLNGQGFRGWMNDVSEAGVGVISAAPLRTGDEIGITIHLPGEVVPLVLRAIVRHTRGFHHGCQFIESQPEHRAQLREFLTDAAVAI